MAQADMKEPHIEFLVEDRSTKAFLDALLPRMLPEICTFNVHSHHGKRSLLKRMGDRLKGYEKWMPGEYRIVILVDCDKEECEQLKKELEKLCLKAGLRSRRAVGGPDWQIVTRIAVEELEAWYFGDWQAVCKAYPRVSPITCESASYRDPDAIKGGTWEAFERILGKHGYFKQGLSKVEAASAIGRHLDPARNRSRSFAVFLHALAEAVG